MKRLPDARKPLLMVDVILDLAKFQEREQPLWDELEKMLHRLADGGATKLSLDETKRLHYLYERSCADLVKLRTFAADQNLRLYLEDLVGRAYGEINETRGRVGRVRPLHWLLHGFPNAFRRHIRAFALSSSAFFLGAALGAFLLLVDPDSRHTTMGFGHDKMTPTERVADEEAAEGASLSGSGGFSGYLIERNIKVTILLLATGMTFGLGTVVILFYNGVIVGAICMDYAQAGESEFLLAWLLPHGSVEIPAILIGGQAAFVLASALIGQGDRRSLRQRMLSIKGDLALIMGGCAAMLVWAGIVEAYISQLHEPALPYIFKILLGVFEIGLLLAFLGFCGREPRIKPKTSTAEAPA